MKNSKYFPFERNKYFYGKLLSVDDFELEQKYVNDKRRMTNRYLFGSGIVAGMYVVEVDEKTVSVEMGYALDSHGREIVIDEPVIKKLSLIEGFENTVKNCKTNYVYLCAEYDEEMADPVHNIASAGNFQNDKEYNKIKESYKLYITDDEPDRESVSVEGLYENIKTVYRNDGIKVKQIIGKYSNTASTTELRIEVENYNKEYMAFSYDLVLSGLSYSKQNTLKVTFDEMLHEKTGKYVLTYTLDVSDVVDMEVSAAIDEKSTHLSIDKKNVEEFFKGKSTTYVTNRDIKLAVIDEYHKMAMEDIVRNNAQDRIYLAKINLINAGEMSIIDYIENVPFNQYIMNNELNYALDKMSRSADDITVSSKEAKTEGVSNRSANPDLKINSGKYSINLGAGVQKGQKLFSNEIIHGLGLGDVTIILGVDGENEKTTFGNSDIFAKSGSPVELAAQVDRAKGSFIIGARVLNTIIGDSLNINWTAIQNDTNSVSEKLERKIFIKPNILELEVLNTHCFEAICQNMNDKAVKWNVRNNGGSIDSNGVFTAPSTPGVYEIVAESIAYPEVKASVFVVVRDNK